MAPGPVLTSTVAFTALPASTVEGAVTASAASCGVQALGGGGVTPTPRLMLGEGVGVGSVAVSPDGAELEGVTLVLGSVVGSADPPPMTDAIPKAAPPRIRAITMRAAIRRRRNTSRDGPVGPDGFFPEPLPAEPLPAPPLAAEPLPAGAFLAPEGFAPERAREDEGVGRAISSRIGETSQQ